MSNFVFIGDSVTLGARTTPATVLLTQTFSYLISQSRGTEINKGVANDNSTGMLARFEADVVAYNPSWIGIMCGTNDCVTGQSYSVNIATYESNVRAMIERGLAIGSSIVLFTPPASNDSAVKSRISDYLQVLRKMPVYYNIKLIDVHQIFSEISHNTGGLSTYLMDNWHPTVAGHALIAGLIDLPQYSGCFRTVSAADAWLPVISAITPDGQASSWNGYTIVQKIAAAQLSNIGLADTRVTFKSGSGGGLKIAAAYIGHKAASGDAYDFETTPTQLLFGGNADGGVTTANTEFAAETPFVVQANKDLLISMQMTDSTHHYGSRKQSATTGLQAYYKSGAEAATVNKTGYTTSNNSVDIVIKIDGR